MGGAFTEADDSKSAPHVLFIERTLDVVRLFTNNPHTRHRAARAPRYSVTQSLRFTISIPADHPSLPGHFPGRPVVPGALILAEVIHAASQALGADTRVAGFPSVK